MADTLIVQLIPPISRGGEEEAGAIDCAAQWLHLSDDATPGTYHPETGQLSHLLHEPPVECQWIVLIPGEDVLTTTVKLPSKRRRQAVKALPFVLEDSVASDVTLEHLAVGPANAQGETLVAITRKQQLRDLLQSFADAGITPHRMLPDYAMLPEIPDTWRVVVSGDRAIVRCPDGTGFSTPVSRLPLLLNTGQDLENDRPNRTASVIRTSDAAAPVLPGSWQIDEQLVDSSLQYLAAEPSSETLNLLQGEFRVIQQDSWNWRPWATAALLALVAVTLGLLDTGLETVRLNRAADQLQAAMVELAREALPDTQQIRDPQTQLLIAWRQLSDRGAGDADFLPLLNRVSATIGQQPVTVLGIDFKDGTLTLALQGSSLQQLDGLRQQIERQGLYASLLNASTENDSARSSLVIQAARPQQPVSTG
jgi:general secretion pathway protein L